jgi:glutathione S-transferase
MTYTLHEYARSGNCYKIRLAAAYAGVPLERREYDIMKGETRTPAFLAEVNDNGRIPVLATPEGLIPESNAACYYLLRDTDLIPRAPFAHAQLLRWLFWEQYNHEPNVATMRFWRAFVGMDNLTELQRLQLPSRIAAAEAALKLMDDRLATMDFMLGDAFSLADIALYAYTHTADEGGFDLSLYPAVSAWLARVAAQPKHVPLDA